MFCTVMLACMGGCGFGLAAVHGPAVDRWFHQFAKAAGLFIKNAMSGAQSADPDLILVSRVISGLRAGLSLDSILEGAATEGSAIPGSRSWVRLQQILQGKPPPDFLSSFLSASLKSGIPLLQALQKIEACIRARQKLKLKAQSVTAQCRAQAEVLSWLPWCLALAIALLDRDWFATASKQPISWLLWSFAIALTGMGRMWLKVCLKKALSPTRGREELEETLLPDLILRISSEVSLGRDLESAIEQSLLAPGMEQAAKAYQKAQPSQDEGKIAQLKSILAHAARTGAPVRDELLAFLQDLQVEVESRWEACVQRLPVILLAPLFLCFFPSSLLVLAGLLAPLLRAGL